MKKILRTANGFTLLELIISISIIAVIVSIALGGIKFGISTREVSDQKTETYQRLRFIGEQISSKIRSFHPLFIQLNPVQIIETGITNPTNTPKKLLAFEGLEDSIKFITFADNLAVTNKSRWLHEVQFYLGEHPETRESGIIMMEQNILFDEAFVTPDPQTTQYFMLAKDVSYLKFRYYKSRKPTPEELSVLRNQTTNQSAQTNQPVQYIDEWVNTIPLDYGQNINLPTGANPATTPPVEDLQSKISSPRAVEISIGLKEPQIPGRREDLRLIYLPPMIIPFHAGGQVVRPPREGRSQRA